MRHARKAPEMIFNNETFIEKPAAATNCDGLEFGFTTTRSNSGKDNRFDFLRYHAAPFKLR